MAKWQPIRYILKLVNHYLEPFAEALWNNELCSYATHADRFTWRKKTFFGGVYQVWWSSTRIESLIVQKKARTGWPRFFLGASLVKSRFKLDSPSALGLDLQRIVDFRPRSVRVEFLIRAASFPVAAPRSFW